MKKTSELSNIIADEYKVWRKNVPFLYDVMYTHLLDWQSPSVQWFPDIKQHTNNSVSQKLLLTTFTNTQDKEYLLVGNVTFPDPTTTDSISDGNVSFSVSQRIVLSHDINKSRYCPQSPNLVACKGDEGEILVFDLTVHPSEDTKGKVDFLLKGHEKGGFALEWNTNTFGELISGGSDNRICIFDINGRTSETMLKHSFCHHKDIVNDVSFSCFNPNLFISCSDDKSVVITDTRSPDETHRIIDAHSSSVESVSYSPHLAELFATTSSDSLVKVWDSRSTKLPLLTLRGHANSVMCVKWSPFYESLLASSGKDRRIFIWDLNNTGNDENDCSQEVLFIHGGHTGAVDDFDWNPCEPMEIASVSTDNMLHVWKIPVEEYIPADNK